MAVSRYAVVEIAAQEILLKVYEITAKSGIRCIDSVCRRVPVGRDTYSEGRISADVLDQICDSLKSFCRILSEYRIDQVRAVATSAVREAKNCSMVLDQIRVRTGFDVAVLSNSEQRFIRLKGAAALSSVYSLLDKGSMLVDMGSGSLQVSIFEKMVLMTTQNISLGAVSTGENFAELSEEIGSVEGPLQEIIDNDIHTFEKMFLKEREIKNIVFVGEGAAVYIRRYLEKSTGGIMSADTFREFYRSVSGKSSVELCRMLEIPAEYAAMVTSAILVYEALLDATKAELICLPKADLCDGIVQDAAESRKLVRRTHDFNEDILAASRNICKRYMGNKKHAAGLEECVCEIFDAIKKYHGMGERERLLLQIAAILHDCGKFISMSAPGENSYHIIMSTEILGLSHAEREIVANVAKYNTMDIPSYHEFEGKLSVEQYLVVMKLAVILRVANALDRSHKQKFAQMKLSIKDSTLMITTEYPGDILLEEIMLEKKAGAFEEVYGLHLQIRQKKKKGE